MSGQAWLRGLYAATGWIYPWRFRAAFGDEMRLVFAQALAAASAAGPRAVAALCVRELRGLPASLAAQYARAWGEETARLRAHSVEPSWAQALAAIAPGLLLVSGYWLFRLVPGADVDRLTWLSWALAGVFVAAGAWAARRGWRATTWVLPTLGLLACVGLVAVMRGTTNAGLLVQHALLVAVAGLVLGLLAWRGLRLPRAAWLLLGVMALLALTQGAYRAVTQTYFGADDPTGYRLYLVLSGLLPLALTVLLLLPGLFVARWQGLGAVLLLLGPSALLIDLLADPTYGVRSSPLPAQALWAPLLRSLLYGGLLVVAPLWVLRARTAAGQVSGVVVGLLVAMAGVLIIPYLYWRQQMIDLFLLAELSLGVLAALAAYGWDRTLAGSVSPMSAYALTPPSSQEPL